VLASFSGVVVALLHTSILIGFGIGKCTSHSVIVLQIGPLTSTTLVLFGITVWILFYWAALPAHREAGKIVRSLVDNVMPLFVKWVKEFDAPLTGSTAERVEKIRSYLAEPSNN
jgi:hypothetical protein